jgi:hypothetical protein
MRFYFKSFNTSIFFLILFLNVKYADSQDFKFFSDKVSDVGLQSKNSGSSFFVYYTYPAYFFFVPSFINFRFRMYTIRVYFI